MKSITHENRRRFTIITIVSVLFVAILTTTLVLLLKKDTTAPTNTIEVGKRIDTTLGGGRKLLNASVWDGSSSTIWTNGSGTETDPYLIESAEHLKYLAISVSNGTTYEGMYFLQTVDIDLNCFIVSQTSTFTTTRTTTGTSAAFAVGDTFKETSTSGDWTYNDTLTVTKVTQTTVSILRKEFTYTMSVSRVATKPIVWRSIGETSNTPFNGTYDGGGFTIANAYAPAGSIYSGLFGYVKGATIKNLHVQYDPNVNVASYYTSLSCGGLIGTSACAPDSIGTTTISNVKVSGFTYIGTGTLVGGLIADGNANVDNVIIENICIKNMPRCFCCAIW